MTDATSAIQEEIVVRAAHDARDLRACVELHRKVYPVVRPKVEYSLTPYGRTLRPITDLMCVWGIGA